MRYKYSRFVGDDLEGIDLEDLLSKLSDLLLASGFDDPYGSSGGESRDLSSLYDAILEALLNGGLLSDEALERLMGDPADADGRSALEDLVDKLVRRMAEEGYITLAPDLEAERVRRDGAGRFDEGRDEEGPTQFEVTDKGLDFLGYRALRDLLGSIGKSHFGRHDTRDFATGVETSAAPKPYEFGDTLNLDASATVLNAVQRLGAGALAAGGGALSIDVEHEDLMVVQGEYQSSCATVVMLDCSHSMILYGEDRFTPAKRVALALSNLIRHQYPGDALHLVLFHDSAEEVPLSRLARVRVGPYYTNTREGLRLARRILERQRKDMRQIVMITDGKPSALTLPDGRIYRNAFGLDPLVVGETFAEVAACRKAGIMINTFMLARDYDLVAFVRRVAEICHGKAYFTTPETLGQYVLFDYVTKKTRTVH
ncbi:MAG: VWA domain-containing protein [Vicinamibacteraceae bacterium]|nr:VWA domain-containing protein [Vicinamibacteraceae bacterium]